MRDDDKGSFITPLENFIQVNTLFMGSSNNQDAFQYEFYSVHISCLNKVFPKFYFSEILIDVPMQVNFA